MRIAVLTTSTNNTVPIYAPLSRMGHRIAIVIYDEMMSHSAIEGIIEATGADAVVYIGAIPHHHGKPVPGPAVLAGIGARWPLVHICFDGAEPDWWPIQQSYYDVAHFALQVNIDGVRTGPIGERGVTALCPVDPESFGDPPPWQDRPIRLGFAGNRHVGPRARIIDELVAAGIMTHRPRDDDGAEGFKRFLQSCRCIWNYPETGGLTSQHVKARVIEASLAGCLVLERKGSPTEDWFVPGEDYVEYQDPADVRTILAIVDASPEAHKEMARRMRRKVIERHSPDVFWSVVLGRLGLGPHVRPTQPAKFLPYPRPIGAAAGDAPILIGARGRDNVVSWRGKTYLVPLALGDVRLERIDISKYPSIREVRSQPQPPQQPQPAAPSRPAIIKELYGVRFHAHAGTIYAAPKRLGAVDVTVWHPDVKPFPSLAAAMRAAKIGMIR